MGFFNFLKRTAKVIGKNVANVGKSLGHNVSRLYNFINDQPLLKSFSEIAKQFLGVYGEAIITGISICRTPISNTLSRLLNLISLGNWSLAQQDAKYDKLYHLFMLISYNLNGLTGKIIYEKNDKPEFHGANRSLGETIPVQILKNCTINEMCNDAIGRVGAQRYFVYKWDTFNCQQFIKDNLINPAFNYTVGVNNFVMQDISQLVKRIPNFSNELINKVTTFFNKFKTIIS
jgi:F0F1-type ATP synthase gamma subunit